MIWNDVFGLLLALAGVALFVRAWGARFSRVPSEAPRPETPPGPTPEVRDELGERLARRVRHDRRRNDWLAGCGVALIVLAWLTVTMPGVHRAWTSPAARAPGQTAGPSVQTPPVPQPDPTQPGPAQPGIPPSVPPALLPPADNAHLALWPLAAGGMAAMLIGGVVMVLGRATWVRMAGAATLLSGLTANGALIKEVKISDIFKFDTKIDKPTLEIELNRRLQQLSEFGPEQLALLDGFTPGDAALLPHMKAPLQAVCERWRSRGGRGQRGLILVVGSTDRVSLNATARLRYESNVGLARARAEQAKARLVECDIPPSQLMTLVSGPRNTPVDRPASAAEPGFAEDRSVAVWALWSVPARLKP